MSATKFFKNAFAVAGDKTAIPDGVQPGGLLSYTEGYGVRYEEDQEIDPTALDIDRDQFNQLMNDITTALQQYQTIGIPNFVTTAQNGGTPFEYQKFAFALYDDGVNGERIYQSLEDNNDALPTDNTKWRLIDNVGDSIIFPNAVFDAAVNDGDAVYWTGAEYDQAVANGTASQNAVGIADVTNGRVYAFGSVPALLSGLTPGSVYYLSTATPGLLTTVIPARNRVRLGVAKSATILLLNPQVLPDDFPVVKAASVTLLNPQSIPGSNTPTLVEFDTVEFDTDTMWNATDFLMVAQRTGVYRISATLIFGGDAAAATGENYIEIWKNGVLYKRFNEVYGQNSDLLCVGSLLVKLNGADNISLRAVNNSGTAINVGGSAPGATLQMEFVGY
jgi:hypothetical protein